MNMQLCVLLLFFLYIYFFCHFGRIANYRFPNALCNVMILIVHTVNDDGIRKKKEITPNEENEADANVNIERQLIITHTICILFFPIFVSSIE